MIFKNAIEREIGMRMTINCQNAWNEPLHQSNAAPEMPVFEKKEEQEDTENEKNELFVSVCQDSSCPCRYYVEQKRHKNADKVKLENIDERCLYIRGLDKHTNYEGGRRQIFSALVEDKLVPARTHVIAERQQAFCQFHTHANAAQAQKKLYEHGLKSNFVYRSEKYKKK